LVRYDYKAFFVGAGAIC